MHTVIDIHVKPTRALSPSELDDIWAVTNRYVETPREVYEKKLMAMPEVGLWRTRAGELVGLVGLDVYRTRWQGRESIVFFTSSVVIDARYRGQNLVARTGFRMVLREKGRRPWLPAYWLFDTFSYKSYLVIARNFTVFWPRHDRATPSEVEAFLDHLARDRYGEAWDRERGVVHRSGTKRLRPTTAPIDERTALDPDVQFFERMNPGHADGDMLVCLAPLTFSNLVGAFGRALRPRRRR